MNEEKDLPGFSLYANAAQSFMACNHKEPQPWGEYSKNPWCNLSKKQYKKMKSKRKMEKQTRKKNRGKK